MVKRRNKFKTVESASEKSLEEGKDGTVQAEWKTVDISDKWDAVMADGNETGFLSLEELDASSFMSITGVKLEELEDVLPSEEPAKKKRKSSAAKKPVEEKQESQSPLEDCEMTEWAPFNLSPLLVKGLAHLRFAHPTPIQEFCLPAGILHKKNIVAASQTGSGKTLAFGLPMLDRFLYRDQLSLNKESKSVSPLRGLIMAPTRELALQVSDHLKAVAKFTDLKIAPLVGGMSLQKQDRILKQRPDVIVASPGRLFYWISEAHVHLTDFSALEFIVLDEADRLFCEGHFGDLYKILEHIAKYPFLYRGVAGKRQVFLFSATLVSEEDVKIKEMYERISRTLQLDLDDKSLGKTARFDLSPANQVSSSLQEYQMQCPDPDKDVHLYYYLLQHPTRTLIFANSIASVRRLSSLLALLNLPVFALHSSMQQRQRLKNLDRLRQLPHCVLVCTDVASRGLDIPLVELVVHYHAPRTEELYVHRSGRTARAGASGVTLSLVGSSESSLYGKLWTRLHHGKAVPNVLVDHRLLKVLNERVELAVKIDLEMNFRSKRKSNLDWFVQNAEAMELELDEPILKQIEFDESDGRELKINQKLLSFKNRLKELLAQPVEARASKKSSKFVTIRSANSFE